MTQGREQESNCFCTVCVKMQLSAERNICRDECLEARDIALGPEVQPAPEQIPRDISS